MRMKLATQTIHSGYHADGPNQPVVPPLQPGTIWTHPEDGFDNRAGSLGYARYGNPNRNELEQILSKLEGGSSCTVYASGMAAIMAVLQAHAPGDHVLVCDDVYHGTRALLGGIMHRWGLHVTYVDATSLDAIAAAITPQTRLIWLESPSNPMMRISDIAGVCRLAAQHSARLGHKIRVGVDNTWATPVLQHPLQLGADLVMHSCTKYLGGHSDILAGAIICREDDDFALRLKETHKQVGAVLPAFDSWMLVRSIKTLVPRVRMHCENARQIAAFLDQHPHVEKVYYPGLPHATGHAIAREQMEDFGGMISFLVKADKPAILKGIRNAALIQVATSLGGVESLWEHRQSSEGPASATPVNLVRLSVGLEDPDDLIRDIDQVLHHIVAM
jgi:cystathionine gamma-synthase